MGNDWQGEELNLRALEPLVALQELQCSHFEHVELRGSALLPQLVALDMTFVEHVEVDAALPRLRRLGLRNTPRLELAGEQLQLPQLSQLSLAHVESATVQWQAAPQLASLAFVELQVTTAGLSALQHLTSLTLGYSWNTVCPMLRDAPSTVQHLDLQRCTGNWDQPPQLGALPLVTSLISGSPDIIPHLGPLTQLQHLEFPSSSALELSLEQVDWLCSLPSLHQLRFGKKLGRDSAVDRRMQVLSRALPTGCSVEQPMRE